MEDARVSFVFVVVVSVVAASVLGAASPSATGEPPTLGEAPSAGGIEGGVPGDVLVVDDDGSGEYASIQAAVDDASAGETVEVRPGTYREQVVVGKNVTVTAPAGAVLNGSEFERLSSAFRIERGVRPVISGFTVEGYGWAVNANRPPRQDVSRYVGREGWVVRNLTVASCREAGVRAGNTMLDWTVEDVRIEGADCNGGISTFGSHGDWTVRNVAIRDVTWVGIDAATGGGNWTIRNVSVVDARRGIDAQWSNGNGTIADVTVRGVYRGLSFGTADASIVVSRSVLADVSHPVEDPAYRGTAVYAVNADGDWTIRNSVVRNYSRFGINASDANATGVATSVWWGDDGSGANACVGNVTCGDGLASAPAAAGASLDAPGAPPVRSGGEPTDVDDQPTGGTSSASTASTASTTVATAGSEARPRTTEPEASLPGPGALAGAVAVLGLVLWGIGGRPRRGE